MENPLIQELRDALAFSAGYRSEKHPAAEAIVMASQASVRAVLDELELLRATPGGATEIHVLDNGGHVTGERAALLLDDETRSHKNTARDLVTAEATANALRTRLAEVEKERDALAARVAQLESARPEHWLPKSVTVSDIASEAMKLRSANAALENSLTDELIGAQQSLRISYEHDRLNHVFFLAALDAVGMKGEVGTLGTLQGKVVERIVSLKKERDEMTQWRTGHLPSCADIDNENMRCGCGYLDGTAYRELRDANAALERDERWQKQYALTCLYIEKTGSLERALGVLVDAVNVEFGDGRSNIGGKTGPALIAAVNALAEANRNDGPVSKRLEELRQMVTSIADLRAQLSALSGAVAAKDKALRFYADESNWDDRSTASEGGEEECEVILSERVLLASNEPGWIVASAALSTTPDSLPAKPSESVREAAFKCSKGIREAMSEMFSRTLANHVLDKIEAEAAEHFYSALAPHLSVREAGKSMPCPHCGHTLLWSEDRGAHCDGCDDFDPETDIPEASTNQSPHLSGGEDAKRDDHWAAKKALRVALVQTIEPLYMQLLTENFGIGKTGTVHLSWMCKELLANIDVFPVDKTSRWIGFIQGVMAANHRLDVDAERDRTRPLFKKAYDMAAALRAPQPTDEKSEA